VTALAYACQPRICPAELPPDRQIPKQAVHVKLMSSNPHRGRPELCCTDHDCWLLLVKQGPVDAVQQQQAAICSS
jgi:hypothetical protein